MRSPARPRKRDRGAVDARRRATRRRPPPAARSSGPRRSSGASRARRSPRSGPAAPVAVGPARPRGARRQPSPVPQPRRSSRSSGSAWPAFGGSVLALPVAAARAGASAPRSTSAASPTSTAKIDEGEGFAYYPEGRMWVTDYPAAALGKADAGVLAARAGRHGGRARGALPEVPAPRLPRAAVPHLAVVRVPVPRLAVQPVGEKKGGPAPRGLDRFAHRGRRRRAHRRTPASIIQGPPIGTNTTGQEAEGPHCVGGGEH